MLTRQNAWGFYPHRVCRQEGRGKVGDGAHAGVARNVVLRTASGVAGGRSQLCFFGVGSDCVFLLVYAGEGRCGTGAGYSVAWLQSE